MYRYYAVGIPAGALNHEDHRYLYAAGNILGIKSITYRIWSYFLGGNTSENIISNPDFSIYNDPEGLRSIIEEMSNAGLIVAEREIGKYIPLRHGVGTGYQNNGSYMVYTDHPHYLPVLPYLFWLFSDGENTFEEIIKKLQQLDRNVSAEEAGKAVDLLFAESILFLSREA